ncbi:DUF159 family protein [Halobacteriales archaeon QS_8_69_26]|nr:MAG: DUF159 family protein [Halobacteriales archaeon QS_8_69_26]
MCGRYSLFTPPDQLEDRFDARFPDGFEPTYNAAPGQDLPVIRNEDPDAFADLTWGLVPSWADDPSDFEFINARSETVAEKPSFRSAYERRRCLVPADGFYEWTGPSGDRRPYRVRLTDDRPFGMAGVWETWEGTVESEQAGLDAFTDDGGPDLGGTRRIDSFAILTTEPNEVVADLHDRMAVIVPPGEEGRWLTDDDPSDLLEPYPAEEMEAYPVSRKVNDPANDSPELIEPA